jgi:hypothetical protein
MRWRNAELGSFGEGADDLYGGFDVGVLAQPNIGGSVACCGRARSVDVGSRLVRAALRRNQDAPSRNLVVYGCGSGFTPAAVRN